MKYISSDPIRHVITGPFSAFFSNVNTKMRLKGHSHFAQVTLYWQHFGPLGFPSFESTHAIIQHEIRGLLAKPLKDHTNEDVAQRLFDNFCLWHPEYSSILRGWPDCDFALQRLDLAVRGVPDNLGHADAFTTYTIQRYIRPPDV